MSKMHTISDDNVPTPTLSWYIFIQCELFYLLKIRIEYLATMLC